MCLYVCVVCFAFMFVFCVFFLSDYVFYVFVLLCVVVLCCVPFYILGFSPSPSLRHYLSIFGGSEFYRILKSRTALVPVRDFNDPIK